MESLGVVVLCHFCVGIGGGELPAAKIAPNEISHTGGVDLSYHVDSAVQPHSIYKVYYVRQDNNFDFLSQNLRPGQPASLFPLSFSSGPSHSLNNCRRQGKIQAARPRGENKRPAFTESVAHNANSPRV